MDPTPFQTRSKLYTHYLEQVEAIRGSGDPYPVQIEVNPTGACDHHCGWCISEDMHTKEKLDFENARLQQFLRDFQARGGRALTWSGGGEPTLHPAFAFALELVRSCELPQGLLTHGAFSKQLREPIAKHCDWVRISIDTHDPAAWNRRRGGKDLFQRVCDNVRALVELGTATVGLNMNASEWNKHHIEPLFSLAQELRVHYLQVRPTLPTPFQSASPDNYLNPNSINGILAIVQALGSSTTGRTSLKVSWDKFYDLRQLGHHRLDTNRGYRGCAAHRLLPVLNCTGDLSACMYQLFDQRFILGNTYQQSLEEIWTGERRRAVIEFTREELDHGAHECQVCCKGHELNKVLLTSSPLEAEAAPNGGSVFL